MEGPPLLCVFPGGNGADQTGIQTAGQKAAHRNIGYQLAADGVGYKLPDHFYGVFEGVRMFSVGEFPVPFGFEFSLLPYSAASGLQFEDTAEYTAPRSSARSNEQKFRCAGQVNGCLKTGIAENGLDLRGKNQTTME